MRKKRKIIIAAGGSGGHVFPAQALAEELCNQNWDVHFISEERGSEWRGFDERLHRHKILVGNFGAGNFFKKFLNIFFLLGSIAQSLRLIYKIQPQVVIGFGGYPSFPVMLASLFHKSKKIIHEQNAILGRVNRWLHPFVDVIALSIPLQKSYTKTVQIGMPVRTRIRLNARQSYPPIADVFSIVVLGGSQGAKVFNDVLPAAFQALASKLPFKLKIIQQSRSEFLDDLKKTYEKIGLEVELYPFIDNISEVLVKSHLVISRAGASSIAEITLVGRPSILIPFPWAMDDHQTANAQYAQKAGAAWAMNEKEFKGEAIALLLEDIFNHPHKLEKAAKNASEIGPIDAINNLIRLINR